MNVIKNKIGLNPARIFINGSLQEITTVKLKKSKKMLSRVS